MRLEIQRLLAEFGSSQQLVSDLFLEGLPPVDPSTVRQWVSRGNIPTHRLCDLLALYERQHGVRLDLYEFMRG